MSEWRDISTAPRDGTWIQFLIPYDRSLYSEEECIDMGLWSDVDGCFRFLGDDGPGDIQPTHWRPYPREAQS